MKAILSAAWAAILFVTSLPAAAAQLDSEARSVSVDYSDLDLTRQSGASTLEHRVNGAIRQVCGGPAFGLNETMQLRSCERAAGTAASRDVQTAITNAKELSSTRSTGTAATGIADKGMSSSGRQLWTGHDRIPPR